MHASESRLHLNLEFAETSTTTNKANAKTKNWIVIGPEIELPHLIKTGNTLSKYGSRDGIACWHVCMGWKCAVVHLNEDIRTQQNLRLEDIIW